MPLPSGYVLSERDARLIQEFLYVFKRQQHYVNAFGRPGDDKIDHEEMHTTEVYIARSPVGGIPALQSMGSTGIGDIPGSALCTVFKTSQSADLTQDVTGYQHTVYNLATTVIPGDTWLIIVRDKYGKWYALQSMTSEEGAEETIGPGWTAGLSNEDCLLLSVRNKSGKCSTIPNQEILLISDDGLIWEGLDDFVFSGGAGVAQFTRPTSPAQSVPALALGPYNLLWDAAGIDADGNYWIEFKGGTSLCSDVPGTGSGTGGTRGNCGSNTFTIRLTCAACEITTACENDGTVPDAAAWSNKTGGATCLPNTHAAGFASFPGPWTWSTNTCEGNINYSIECIDGVWTLSFSNVGITAEVVSFDNSPFELVLDVTFADGVLGTSPSSGTARLTITE